MRLFHLNRDEYRSLPAQCNVIPYLLHVPPDVLINSITAEPLRTLRMLKGMEYHTAFTCLLIATADGSREVLHCSGFDNQGISAVYTYFTFVSRTSLGSL